MFLNKIFQWFFPAKPATTKQKSSKQLRAELKEFVTIFESFGVGVLPDQVDELMDLLKIIGDRYYLVFDATLITRSKLGTFRRICLDWTEETRRARVTIYKAIRDLQENTWFEKD